jgi:hypothetical protein
MNDEDLRDLFAGFAMLSKMWISPHLEDYAKDCYRIADAMIEAKYHEEPEPEVGIAAVKRKRKTKETI